MLEAADELIEELWGRVSRTGVTRHSDYPDTLQNEFIQNFALDFDPKVGTRVRSGRLWRARNDGRNMSYEAFLRQEGQNQTENPYRDEIMSCPLKLPDYGDADAYSGVDGYLIIDTEEKLENMIDDILRSNCPAIGIDVEHSNEMSYRGTTCLIQISTPSENYVIDPLPMFMEVRVLNTITTDASIVKVLHNAEMDVAWLQRDFGVYIVNAFDTGLAARLLGFPGGHSLANVLLEIFNVSKDTAMARADWSARPLSKRMLNYAVNDAMHLLPLYKHFGEQLARLSKQSRLVRSYKAQLKATFSMAYQFRGYNLEGDARSLAKMLPVRHRGEGLDLLRVVLAWRDIRCRALDVPHHVLMGRRDLHHFVKGSLRSGVADEPPIHHSSKMELAEELCEIVDAFFRCPDSD